MASARSHPMSSNQLISKQLISKSRPTRFAAALLCVAFAISSCASAKPNPNPSPNAKASPGKAELAASYMAIARPANHRLEVAVDSYNRLSRTNFAVAKADLREEAATESWFDRRLLKIAFPPAILAVAIALVRANYQRIDLTRLQSRATNIAKMLAFNGQHAVADAAVEAQVRIIRKDLGLPPPKTS